MASARGQDWEFIVTIPYNESASIDGKVGSSADLNEDWGFGLGFGYNLNAHLQLGGLMNWSSRSYDARLVDENGQDVQASGYLDSSTLSANATYYLLDRTITPFASGGIGRTYVDTNIHSGPVTGCWWDPYWGYICSTYYPTKTEDALSYTAGLGLRGETTRGLALQGSYNGMWIDFKNTDDMPRFDVWRLDLMFRMRACPRRSARRRAHSAREGRRRNPRPCQPFARTFAMRQSALPLIPAIAWLRAYQRPWLRPDVVAGLTAAAVVIPKAMAYATIAGLPVQVRLYTAFVPLPVYALLGTSRPLSASTTTTIAILAAAARVLVPPGVVVDGRLVYSGGVPDRKRIESWLTQPAPEEHASFVFLLDDAGGVHPLPHELYVELAKGEATAPEFAGRLMRVSDWYVRLDEGTPLALVNETHALMQFDAAGRIDWAATPSFHPHRDGATLASESASLPSPQERERMLELVFGVSPEA